MSLQIRAASPDDLPTLVDYACAMAWETERKRLQPEVVQAGIAAVFARPDRGRYLVATRADGVVGALMLTYEWSDWRCADWWWIQSVYVTPSARRSGVFRALYRHVAAEAAAQGESVCGLRLYVEHDNLDAQATYASLGMQHSQYELFEFALPWVASVVDTP